MASRPSPLTGRTSDAVAGLSVFVVCLVAIPSSLIVGPLGGAGTPAQIAGMVLAAGWVLMLAASAIWRQVRVGQPVRVAMLIFLAAVLASYVVATTRPIGGDELRCADLGLLIVVSWAGVQFAAMDCIPTRERLDVLLRRLVMMAGAMATLGLIQYVTKQAWTGYLQIPGLRANTTLTSVYGRDGFTRPAATALHPIEFGAVMTMALPFALHYAFVDTWRAPLRRWYPVAALAFAIPISISRSAIVSTVVVLCVVIPAWPRARRRVAYIGLVGFGAVLYVIVPGLLGTLTGLFSSISTDSSAQSRTGSYALAWEFIARKPIFGRGFGTFLPSYRILDNQYLGLLIETGVVGLTAFLALLGAGVSTAVRSRRRATSVRDRGLAVALCASLSSATLSFALFDAFSFPMASGMLFVVLGAAGALRRLQLTGAQPVIVGSPHTDPVSVVPVLQDRR